MGWSLCGVTRGHNRNIGVSTDDRRKRTRPVISPVTFVHAGQASHAGQSVKVMVPETPAAPVRTHTADILAPFWRSRK